MKEVNEALSLLKRAVELLESSLDDTHDGICPDFKTVQPTSAKKANPTVAVQPDLFTASQFEAGRKAVERTAAAERAKARAKASVRKRGTPGIGKTQAMKNFREIAGGRELLTLADVNRIFGYNESTHGRFVKDAIKQCRLATAKCGAKVKFVSANVRRFIEEYYKFA